tara:strand:- start:4190 stop:4567 length:378 start_codon:yes stop_codon:yes gene_type:complete
MINHSNAPKFGYAGYTYRPAIEHEDEEGIRKATHFVYLDCDEEPAFVIDASPYSWLTMEEFQYHVDMKQGGVEKLTEDQVLHKFPELYGGFSCVIELITELANGDLDPVEFRKFVLTEETDDADV